VRGKNGQVPFSSAEHRIRAGDTRYQDAVATGYVMCESPEKVKPMLTPQEAGVRLGKP